jgi:ethanolamine ammonia-lyase small subunit
MSTDPTLPAHAWTAALRGLTPARVALGRTGAALPTAEVLRFGHAHALARDAVHAPLQTAELVADFDRLGLSPRIVASAAPDRATYLRRPDLGRRLAAESRAVMAPDATESPDLIVVIADGLSATAIHGHAVDLLGHLWPAMKHHGWRVARPVIATQARVALGDEVGELARARMVLMLIGERPGLSAPDSMGAYLTYAPRVGRRDHERNCVSNIRAGGLVPRRAADNLLWLITEALRRGETGVVLKDESRDHEAAARLVGPAALP